MGTLSRILYDFDVIKQGKEMVKSLGVVFGDIGTSPLYALPVIFPLIRPSAENVFGVLSLIVWTLVILVMVEYALLAMSLGKKGEGGTIVLKEILIPLLKTRRQVAIVTAVSFVGIALFLGDGVITPAMSILSAVEGISLVPGCAQIGQGALLLLACAITIALFVLQRSGTEKVSSAFGPIMLVWFLMLAISGLCSILQEPSVIAALNPIYAIRFMAGNGWTGFFVLSGVILCATGGEALYADMGHLGRKPILHAWYFVFVTLVLNYLGQGAFFLHNPQAKSVLYEFILHQVPVIFYISFLILSIIATVIASQAMISGIFSVVYQGITTNIIPMLKVDYTSSRLRSQVYISSVNWVLMFAVLFILLLFERSENLAAAYGFAVTGTMTLTAITMIFIFWYRRSFGKMIAAACVSAYAFLFFLSNMYKIPHGGYWSIIIALCPLALIWIYTSGQKKLLYSSQPLPLELFLEEYEKTYSVATKIKGTALFFVRDVRAVQSYVVQTMFKNDIFYEDNILISVATRDDPFGVIGFFKGSLAPGFRIFEIHMGYMEMLDIEKILNNAGIDAKVMFYGIEEIVSKNIAWKVFAFIKHVTPSFVQFYKLPQEKLHGVVTSVEF